MQVTNAPIEEIDFDWVNHSKVFGTVFSRT